MMLLIIWTVVIIAAVVLYYRQQYTRFNKYGVKHLPPIPIFGNLGRVLFRIDNLSVDALKTYNSFPKERFVGRYEFSNSVAVIRDINLIKQIVVKDFEHFLDHSLIFDEQHDPLFGRNLFTLKGQEWKDMRSTLSPAFTSSKMRLMVPFMVEVGNQMIKAINKNMQDAGVGYADIECKDLLSRYTNDVIASCAFGLKVDSHMEKDNDFYKMAKIVATLKFKQMLIFLGLSSFPKLMKKFNITLFSESTQNFFKHLVDATMKDREAHNIVRPDMIHLLMEAKKGKLTHEEKNDADAGFATVEESDVGKNQIYRVWSDNDLTAQVLIFLVAGFDTVSTAMSFLIHELAMNPDIQEKLYREIQETSSSNGGKFDFNSIQKMEYMDMVVSEVLRLWPPAISLDRLCIKDYNMGKPNDEAKNDFILRKGDGVDIPVWAIHRDPQYYPNPEKFDPERFSEENKHNIKPFTYMPFGLGPRNCIGSRFALCEIKVMAYHLLQHMEISPCEKTNTTRKLANEGFMMRLDGGHWMMLLIIWTVVFIAAVILYFRQLYTRFNKYGVKNLSPIPIFGNIGRVIFRIENISDDTMKTYNSFPKERFVGKYEFTSPIAMIRDIDLIKRIVVKDFEHFLDHSLIFDEQHDPLFGRNLFTLKGQEWKDMRSTLSPAFTSSKMRLMVPFMVEVGNQMIKAINNNIKDSGVGYTDIECKDLLSRYANDVIASCAFGFKVDSHTQKNNDFYKMAKIVATLKFKQMMIILGFSSFPKLMKKFNITLFPESTQIFFKRLVDSTMKNREAHNIIRHDMIHLLMEAKKGKLTHDEKNEEDAGFATVEESDVGKNSIDRVWSDNDLTAQVLVFLIAGFDTVSTAMSFLIHELAMNPDIQEKLYKEIQETSTSNGGKFDFNSIQKLEYMDMVVSEVLRLWPPAVSLDRLCIKDYNMGKPNDDAKEDFVLRKGEAIDIPVWAIHRDPQYYPNPDKFDPERFSEENKHKIKPFTYMPFGLGPRNCIGSRFALCEIKVMAYHLLQHMEISPCEKTNTTRKLANEGFMMRLDGGHWVRFKPRS